MEYIDVHWNHDHPDDPVRLVSELNEYRFEVRKLEFFRSGVVGHACRDVATEGTALGVETVPTLPEINQDAEFVGRYITSTEFESLWSAHAAVHT